MQKFSEIETECTEAEHSRAQQSNRSRVQQHSRSSVLLDSAISSLSCSASGFNHSSLRASAAFEFLLRCASRSAHKTNSIVHQKPAKQTTSAEVFRNRNRMHRGRAEHNNQTDQGFSSTHALVSCCMQRSALCPARRLVCTAISSPSPARPFAVTSARSVIESTSTSCAAPMRAAQLAVCKRTCCLAFETAAAWRFNLVTIASRSTLHVEPSRYDPHCSDFAATRPATSRCQRQAQKERQAQNRPRAQRRVSKNKEQTCRRRKTPRRRKRRCGTFGSRTRKSC